ncbi:MAG: family acetyltransferase [Pseudomonas sp.]|jgi:GNAT superfamily N-acetyltransferase|nr:family acetyltransferase [Pseudomonas sp.]
MDARPAVDLLPATEDDLPFARTLTQQAMQPYYQRFDLDWTDDAFDQAWGWREQWRILHDDRRAGYCSLSQDHHALFIRELHLLPEHRGQGVGGRVLERLAAWAAERRLPALRLMVFRGNPARHLYLRHGFVEVGEDACFLRLQRVLVPGTVRLRTSVAKLQLDDGIR